MPLQAMFNRLSSASQPSPPAFPLAPTGPHEIKYDGNRLRLERDADRVVWSRAAAITGRIAIHGLSEAPAFILYRGARRTCAAIGAAPDGIFVAPFEVVEIGPEPFRKAC